MKLKTSEFQNAENKNGSTDNLTNLYSFMNPK